VVGTGKDVPKYRALSARTGIEPLLVQRLLQWCAANSARPEKAINDAVEEYLRARGA
jgi:hypothetical protein